MGAVIARHLFDSGYRVVLHANRSRGEAEILATELNALRPASAKVVQADLACPDEITRLARDAWAAFEGLDALVNAAAIWEPKRLEEITAADVDRHWNINTRATFLLCQHIGLAMTQQKTGGAIINVGDWAIERPYLDYGAYFPSKGAIPTITRNLAIELAARNPRVRVNAVLPGPVMLPLDMSPEERAAAIAGTLLKREGSPMDVAHAVKFLLESEYITGVCLPVDGGRTICP